MLGMIKVTISWYQVKYTLHMSKRGMWAQDLIILLLTQSFPHCHYNKWPTLCWCSWHNDMWTHPGRQTEDWFFGILQKNDSCLPLSRLQGLRGRLTKSRQREPLSYKNIGSNIFGGSSFRRMKQLSYTMFSKQLTCSFPECRESGSGKDRRWPQTWDTKCKICI